MGVGEGEAAGRGGGGTAEHGYSKIASKTLSEIREYASCEYAAASESALTTDVSL